MKRPQPYYAGARCQVCRAAPVAAFGDVCTDPRCQDEWRRREEILA